MRKVIDHFLYIRSLIISFLVIIIIWLCPFAPITAASADDAGEEWEKPDPSVDSFGQSHYGFCLQGPIIEEPTTEDWSKYASAIFVGTVERTQFRFDKDDLISHRCWSRVVVNEHLKGIQSSEIWVEAYYDPYGENGWKDLWSPENCYLKKGETYLFFGKKVNTSHKTLPTHVIVSKSNSSVCAPILQIGNAKEILIKLYSIL